MNNVRSELMMYFRVWLYGILAKLAFARSCSCLSAEFVTTPYGDRPHREKKVRA